MPLRIVQSKQNARLKELRRALASPGRGDDREAGSVAGGIAGAVAGIEGRNLLEEALRARLTIRSVFVAQEAERLLDGLALPPETEVLLLPGPLLADALATETPQPMAALVEPPRWTWQRMWAPMMEAGGDARLFLLLAGVQDPGNLGTILRSAEAFGASGVVSLPGTVHAWNAKAVRASAGSVFRVPVIAAKAEECFAHLRAHGVTIWTSTARGAEAANRVDLRKPAAFVIGNEGNGVPAELAAQADGAITIPCPGPIESLNAAVAASVLLYETSRQRADGTRQRLRVESQAVAKKSARRRR
jgi:TrmH family RNA methyltransferase